MIEFGLYNNDPNNGRINEVIDGTKTDTDVLQGVSSELFLKIASLMEKACLRFILALLEASSDLAIDTVLASLKGEILMQNMDNMYKLSFKHGKKKGLRNKNKSTAVRYLTLISTLAYGRQDNPLVLLDDLLIQWLDDTAKEGFPTNKLISSVEIVSANSRVQTIYFPIPQDVLEFWGFTEVRKACKLVVDQVDRDSPEDKIMSFYSLMQRVQHVMRRQRIMRNRLTRVGHSLIGGSKPHLGGNGHYLALRNHLHFATILLCFNFTVKEYMQKNSWLSGDVPVMR